MKNYKEWYGFLRSCQELILLVINLRWLGGGGEEEEERIATTRDALGYAGHLKI